MFQYFNVIFDKYKVFQNLSRLIAVVGGGGKTDVRKPGKANIFRALSTATICSLIGFAFYIYKSHPPVKRPPYVPYEYMYKRSKRFPWGDGQKSLFHNKHVNPLPTGYEDGRDEGDY